MRKLAVAVLISMIAFMSVSSNCKSEQPRSTPQEGYEHPAEPVETWQDGFFRQKTVDASKVLKDSVIKAKVDGKWQTFKTTPLPDAFVSWSAQRRLHYLEGIKHGEMPPLAGPHNAMVASYGVRRRDTHFRINNAVKGTGFTPKPEMIDTLIELLESTIDSPITYKIDILKKLYSDPDRYFDRTKILSLELYTTKEFETHTFLNEMANPAVSIVYLDIPSFEVKAIAQLMHPKDPHLSEYEEKIVEYANLIHSYFHGEFKRIFPAVIYHVIEVYDNTPRKGARGRRIMPQLP